MGGSTSGAGGDAGAGGDSGAAGAGGCPTTTTYYRDDDGDGYGVDGDTQDLCAPDGAYTATQGGDCDDATATTHPGAAEVCDGVDNDCNGDIDEGAFTAYYRDDDGDGYGVDGDTQDLCAPDGAYTATQGGDCDDATATTNPGAAEVCDGVDNDCNGDIDENLPLTTYYRDDDGDTYGVTGDSQDLCGPGGAYTATQDGDCDDAVAGTNPGATEVCDAVDNNCDGAVDEGNVCPGDCTASQAGSGLYLFCGGTTAMNRDDAAAACATAGTGWGLASIQSQEENDAVWATCVTLRGDNTSSTSPDHFFWTGGNDLGTVGDWLWSDGSAFTFTNWGSGEPNGGANERCMHLGRYANGLWNDAQCSIASRYICEYTAP